MGNVCYEAKSKSIKPKQDLKHLIWIDANIYSYQNKEYLNEIKSLGFSNIKCFDSAEESINYIKAIKFESTKIIISGGLYLSFISKFKENIKDLFLIPKIAIFTQNKDRFLKYIQNHIYLIYDSFYAYGGINVQFDGIKNFLISKTFQNEIKLIKSNENKELNDQNKFESFNNIELTFEYIDSDEKLVLPLLYQSIININKIDNIEKFNEYLYSKYLNKIQNMNELLDDINTVSNIPIELLCKYYIRLFTMDSKFYKDMNNDLRHDKKKIFLPFIKVLYKGLKLKSLSLTSEKELYRGSKISENEINKIKDYLKNKKPSLPAAIVFSKSFLSFSKNINKANKFLTNVLYILENDGTINYSLAIHADIENISFFKKEKEVLFFPFSCFVIKEINEVKSNNGILYIIKLLYLGKNFKRMKRDKNIFESMI